MDNFNRELILTGTQSVLLKNNRAFEEAITTMYDRLFLAERAILEDTSDIRETGAKLKHNAMMRKTINDFLIELDTLILIGENAEFAEEEVVI